VGAYLAELILGHRAVEQGTPVVDDRQRRSHVDQTIVATWCGMPGTTTLASLAMPGG